MGQTATNTALAITNQTALIDLPTALRLVGAQNLDVQIARQRLAEARANHDSAVLQFFPWLSPGVSYRRHDNLIQDVEGNIIHVNKDAYTVGPTLVGQLEIGDAIYQNLASRQLVKAADFALETQRQDSLLAAAQGYFDLAKAHSSVGVAEEAVRISTNYSAQVDQAVGAGIAFKGDLLRVQVQTDRNRLILRQARERERVASAALAQTLHLDSIAELQPADDATVPLSLLDGNASLDSLVARALDSRPELKQTRALAQAARESQKGALYGPWIPNVGAQVFVGGLGGSSEHSNGPFGESEDYLFTLGWRVGPGGLFDRGRIRATESRYQIAQLTRAKTADDITRQVIEGQTRVQSQGDQMAIAGHAIQTGSETLRLTQARKEFGVGAVLETIDAEQELTRARLDYLTALAEYNKAQYALQKAVGGLGVEPTAASTQADRTSTAASSANPALIETVNFDTADVGRPPTGWLATQTGAGEARWVVTDDDTAPSKPNVLKQSGTAAYPICLKLDTSIRNGFVAVKFKPISGQEDQAGGLVWRAIDANNYYIARANALEDNVTIYHTIAGKRTEKKRAAMKIASGQWHSLRVDFNQNHFVVTVDGVKTIEWEDDTLTEPGMVGVWTKADSVTLFDDFVYGQQ